MGKTAADIKGITNRTHEACIRIIDKQFKAMDNFADRDHCVQVSVHENSSVCLKISNLVFVYSTW
jgi:2-methylcitrate dehydratase PrpD